MIVFFLFGMFPCTSLFVSVVLGLQSHTLADVAIYLVTSFCLYVIARKSGAEYPFFAWFPVLDLYLVVDMAAKPVLWFILLWIPVVNLIVYTLLWMEISAKLKLSCYWGILMCLPYAGHFVRLYLAVFGKRFPIHER